MFDTKRNLIVSLVAVGLFAVSSVAVQGAAINVDLIYLGSYDAGFNPLPGLPLIDDPAGVDPTDFHTFSMVISLTDMGLAEDFQSVGVNIVMGAGFSPEGFGIPQSYFSTPLIFDPPGPPPASDAWFINEDTSTPADLQAIFVVLTNTVAAAALQPGEPGPLEVGTFHVNLDPAATGAGPSGVWVEQNGPWFTWDDGEAVQHDGGFSGTAPHYYPPEPSSVALMALGSMALLRRRA